jgi:hypothetical protein
MNLLRTLFIGILFAQLISCGRGEATLASLPAGTTVLAFGDSLTEFKKRHQLQYAQICEDAFCRVAAECVGNEFTGIRILPGSFLHADRFKLPEQLISASVVCRIADGAQHQLDRLRAFGRVVALNLTRAYADNHWGVGAGLIHNAPSCDGICRCFNILWCICVSQ